MFLLSFLTHNLSTKFDQILFQFQFNPLRAIGIPNRCSWRISNPLVLIIRPLCVPKPARQFQIIVPRQSSMQGLGSFYPSKPSRRGHVDWLIGLRAKKVEIRLRCALSVNDILRPSPIGPPNDSRCERPRMRWVWKPRGVVLFKLSDTKVPWGPRCDRPNHPQLERG